jgi:hypothetical protein
VPLRSPDLRVCRYGRGEIYDALVIALSGAPFAGDNSTLVVRDLCATLPPTCRAVCLVSAHGVGDSLGGAGAAIQAMSAWYLKDTYAAKAAQERLVGALAVPTLILRPRVLSHAPVPLNPFSTTRAHLAERILEWTATVR